MRSLMVVVTIFCVALGWRLHRAKEQRKAVRAIRDAGGWIYYDYQQYDPRTCKIDAKARPWAPDWLMRHVGIDFFHDVVAVNMSFDESAGRLDNNAPPVDIARHLAQFPRARFLGLTPGSVDDAGMKYLGQLKQVEVILFWDAGAITDEGVAHLRNMPRLRSLHLGESQVTDRGLASIAKLRNLEDLSMQKNYFTDAGLPALAGLPGLKSLWIGGLHDRPSPITDVGVIHLARLTQLEELDLQHTRVTPEGLKPLQQLPKLKNIYLNGSSADDYHEVAPMFPNSKVDARTDGQGGNK